MVGTDFKCAVSPHQQADGAFLFVAQQLNVPRTTFLPLRRVVLTGKAVQLCPPTNTQYLNTSNIDLELLYMKLFVLNLHSVKLL